MSAPKTNVETQRKRHRSALLGVKACLIYGAVLLALFVMYLAFTGQSPDTAETQIDGRTGEVESE